MRCEAVSHLKGSDSQEYGRYNKAGQQVCFHVSIPNISADGRTLHFESGNYRRGYGGLDLWQAPIIPIVDFNGDGIVDAADMCIMVDHWGSDEQLCDIGPMPWSDGVVDVQDLIVLAEHLFEEIPPVE
ncbi:MAG: hypothetical protein ACW97O_15835 [Candidatus Thorarchaeota archaeon]